MIRSELILPLRMYDDLYDQFRFNKLCNEQQEPDCDAPMAVASDALPFFQFTRPSSLNIPVSLIMRNVCLDKENNFYKVIPEAAANFTPVGVEPTFGTFPKKQSFTMNDASEVEVTIAALAECGGIKQGSLALIGDRSQIASADDLNDIQFSGVFAGLGGIRYRLKIYVEQFVGASWKIKIWNGNAGQYLVKEIEAAGLYVFEFIAQYDGMTIGFEDISDGCEYLIKYVQVTKIAANLLAGSADFPDVILDESQIKIKQLANGTDIVTYCEGAADYSPKSGTYYYILDMGQEVYFSELFTVKKPVELEGYYCLEWGNTSPNCDLGNIIYDSANLSSCSFLHRLYFDAALFNPQYETEVEEEENGDGDKNDVFKRWKKSIALDLPKCPPFLTDALSGIFLHNYISLAWPLQNMQDIRPDAVTIEKAATEIADTLKNCYQAVKLILTHEDKFSKSNCCDNVEVFECPAEGDDLLVSSGAVGGQPGWFFVLVSQAVPGSMCVIHYNLNGSGYTELLASQAVVDSAGDCALLIDTNVMGTVTTLDVFVRNKTLTCTFEDSSVENLV